jgi:hypothetical protein
MGTVVAGSRNRRYAMRRPLRPALLLLPLLLALPAAALAEATYVLPAPGIV